MIPAVCSAVSCYVMSVLVHRRSEFMRAALLDNSLQSINIEQKFMDVVQNVSADKYVTDPQLHLFNILGLLKVSVRMNALF